MLTENQLWSLIEKAGWVKDPDYLRINKEFRATLPVRDFIQLYEFVRDREKQLDKKPYSNALDGYVSDDSWWDLRSEVVGRGKKFFKTITAKKLLQMAKDSDYKENFGYSLSSFGPVDDLRVIAGIIAGLSAKEANKYSNTHWATLPEIDAWLDKFDPKDLPTLLGQNNTLDALVAERLSQSKSV